MRPIGFPTGALALADFQLGLDMTRSNSQCSAIELSALRHPELVPLLEALGDLDLDSFNYVSLHAPSQFTPESEAEVAHHLLAVQHRGWPIVVHPDVLTNMALWREFGSQLCIENMDKRKPIGRTAGELSLIFEELPGASLCFDIGHARQVDPTMTEAYLILKQFGSKLRQVHVSEVNTRSKHDPLSYASILAFQHVAHLIPGEVPLILETPVDTMNMDREIERVREALPVHHESMVA